MVKSKILNIIDPAIDNLIQKEHLRQRSNINLIASENYAHEAVLEAAGSVLTNKYAEGYPGKRYYAGCQYIDEIEQLAIDRLKRLFSAENMHVNVQPHSGSSANMAVYSAVLKPGDTILGMSLNAGGHLTHGHKVNFSGIQYNSIQYGLDPITELLNYDEIERLALLYKPKLIIAGSSAYSRKINFEKIARIAKQSKALFLVDIAHIAGLVCTGLHESPIISADFITGTTHKTLRGPRGGFIICKPEFKLQIDRMVMPGIQGGPLMHIIAAKAVSFALALKPDFRAYQEQVLKNAKIMAQTFQKLGYKIVSNGTDTHLFVIDLTKNNITGKEAELKLENEGITVSRSLIPNDPARPSVTTGIRIGTAAITSNGSLEANMIELAYRIDNILKQ